MADFRIGDYDYTIIDSSNRYVSAEVWDATKTTYEALSSTVEYNGITYTLTNMDYCFYACTSFNQSIVIPKSVTSMDWCFCACHNFNQTILCFNNPTNYFAMFDSTEKDITIIAIGEDNYSTWEEIANACSNVSIPDSFEFEYGDYKYTGDTNEIGVIAIDKTKTEYGEILKTYINNRKITNMEECFMNCTSFNQLIEIPSSVTNMKSCFGGCTFFNQPIEIPSSVTNMKSCFGGCTFFNQPIEIPNSVTDMSYCFSGCISFNQFIEIPNSVTSMSYCFAHCTSFNQFVEIPNLVTSMDYCFIYCTSFNQPIKIPGSVTNMRSCFGNCESFNQYILCFNEPTSYNLMFHYTKEDITIVAIGENNYSTWKTIVEDASPNNVSIPDSFSFKYGDYRYIGTTDGVRVVATDKTKVEYGEILKTYINNRKVTSMYYCFWSCASFNQPIEIPDSVIDMSYCFCGCRSFNQPIEIPDSVTNMDHCFWNCISFNSPITFKNNSSVTDMSYCFFECASFDQSIEIPDSVTNMLVCFGNCRAFNSPVFFKESSSVTNMRSCFYSCTSFNQPIEIPDSVTDMESCFHNCASFDKFIELPDLITSMDSCFWGCASFNRPIEIPNLVINMNFCFSDCTSLNQLITFKDNSSVTSMYSCFSGCTSFDQLIEIPDSVTSMDWCFSYCTSFNQSIEVPNSVTYMNDCFRGCTSLEADIKIKGPIWRTPGPGPKLYNVFSNTEKDIYIINEAGSSSKESAAEVWRKVANEHPNVHYELDDHPSPLLELEVRRVDSNNKPSTSGIYALVNLKYTISNSFVPYSYPAPSLESESLVLDSIRTIPLTEKRSYLINDIDDNQHVFVYTVSDGYKTSTITKILSRILALLDFQGDSGKDYVDKPGMGMAIGTIATRNGLAIQFPTTIGDELLPATKEVYVLTTDTEFNPEKKYYEKDGDNYVLTEDTEFIDGKEYYEKRKAVDLDNYQLIIGQYNKEDKNSAFIIGNGNKDKRLNALTIDWDGRIKLNGYNGREVGLLLSSDGVHDNSILDVGWNYANVDGASLNLASVNFAEGIDNSKRGAFSITARSDVGEKQLLGKTNGQLTWDGSPVMYGQGDLITLTFRQCTNGAYTRCRKIGKLVIFSFNINVTTATNGYDYITGLPKAESAYACAGAKDGTATRWWVTTEGTLRSDGTPTTGWYDGNVTYICQ